MTEGAPRSRVTGVSGGAGSTGPEGPPGPEGPEGPAGPAGADGADGTDGTDGADGAPGVDGADGTDGADGADGVVTFPIDATLAADTDPVLNAKVTGDANARLEVDADGTHRYGDGTATPPYTFAYNSTNGINVRNELNGSSDSTTVTVRGANSATAGSQLVLQRARGTWASPTNVATSASQVIGQVAYSGYDGTSYSDVAVIMARSTEAWTTSAHGTAIRFANVIGGTTTMTERMRLVDRVLAVGASPTAAASTVERLRVNTPTTADTTAAVHLSPDAATTKPLVVQAAASQTANLVEFQTSAGAVLAAITAAGAFTGATTATATPFVTKTSAYTATDADYSIFVDSTSGAVTISLPTAVGRAGKGFEVKDWKGTSATNNITIDPNGAETIDGAATKALSVAYASLTVRSDGANWGIV